MKWNHSSTEDLLRTNDEDGTVHIIDRRVLMLETESFRVLRNRLSESEGIIETAKMLWNFSYANGYRDAMSTKKNYSHQGKLNWFKTGLDLLAIRGLAKAELISGEIGEIPEEIFLEIEWKNSWEIEDQPGEQNPSHFSGCPTITGWLSGFAAGVTGENILFLDTECRSRGDNRCCATAKYKWNNDDEEIKILGKLAEELTKENFNFNDLLAQNIPTTNRIRKLLTEIEAQKAEIETLQTQVQFFQEIGIEEKPIHEMIGTSSIYKKSIRNADKVAETNSTVLIQGETGTGKELFARYIHAKSLLAHRPLITVNCAALPTALVESELFGHEKGSFTGAVQRKIGRFEIANGATVFLDEIGELPLETQAKFLRVLQEGEFERVGGTQTIKVDVRVLAATNQKLEELVSEGKFRADLFYRLNVFPVNVPPLRSRGNDIVLLVNYFAQKYRKRFNKPLTSVSQASIDGLKDYDFPGNVRELQHLIERSVLLSEGEILEVVLPLAKNMAGADFTDTSGNLVPLEEMERRYVETVLSHTKGIIAGKGGAAELLEMPPSTLRSRMKKLGISVH